MAAFFSRGAFGRRANHRRIERAAEFRQQGDAPSAVDLLAEVLVAQPDDPTANAEMARALVTLGDPSGAEEHFRAALENVLDYSLVVELAQTLAIQGKVAEAKELLDSALFMARGAPRLDPGEALIVRATIAHAQDRPADARAALDAIEDKRASDLTKRYAERLRAEIGPSDKDVSDSD